MTGLPLKNFNLPWNQHESYWIVVYPVGEIIPLPLQNALKKSGMTDLSGNALGVRSGRDWDSHWAVYHALFAAHNALENVAIFITSADNPPSACPKTECKTVAAIQAIADNLWLGDALLEDRIMCYLQPVVSSNEKIFGYESFARVKAPDGSIIAGDQIIAASKALGIEYMIDRHLHIQAITTFVSSEFNGFLFVNFFPGFIHRPAVYLEGLGETAKSFGVISKHIVLDFTKSETPRDIGHIKSVCDYSRSRGYSVALDDIASVDVAKKLIPEIHPDFVKIDMHLVRQVNEPGKRETIRTIVEMAHASAGTVIAEGVETDEIFTALKQLGIDLFQGYLFSPPMPVETALKRSIASGKP